MKVGVIFFHGNLYRIHDPRWSTKCLETIRNQSFKNINYYEINFGDDKLQLVSESMFFHKPMKNYVDAMNFIITKAFEDGCDYVFNTNVDDFYHSSRIEKQLFYLKSGYDLVSSDFCYVDLEDRPFHYLNICSFGNIESNLMGDHNIIAHPAVAFSRRFWEDPSNRYDINSVGREDLNLWKTSIKNGYRFYIVNEVLLYYRIHNNQVTSDNKVGLNRVEI